MTDFATLQELKNVGLKFATKYGLDATLVWAVVEQESSWNQYALRSESESGFMQRYGAAYSKIVKDTANKADDRWLEFEDIFYASYGLMQTMYPCVIEMVPSLAERINFPTQLCDPEIGLDAGCAILKKKLDGANGDVRQGLLHWNGGGDPEYPDKVMKRMVAYR